MWFYSFQTPPKKQNRPKAQPKGRSKTVVPPKFVFANEQKPQSLNAGNDRPYALRAFTDSGSAGVLRGYPLQAFSAIPLRTV